MKVSHSISISILNFSIIFCLTIPVSIWAADKPAVEKEFSLKRPLVKDVKLDGLRSFPDSDIKGILLTKPNHWYNFLKKHRLSRSVVIEDEGTIVRFYKRRGFLNPYVGSQITRELKNRASVTFYIFEGPRTSLENASIEGGLPDINIKFNKTLATLELNKPVDAEKMLANGFKLRDLYFNNGYPFCRISSKYLFNSDSTGATLVYTVVESTYTIEGETRVVTETFTRPNVIARELLLRPGRTYSQKDIVDSEQRLYSTGLFKFVSIRREDSTIVVSGDTARTNFIVSLNERKPLMANISTGIGREPNFDLVWRNSLQLGNRNIWGTGRKLSISVKPYFQIADSHGNLSTLHISDLGKKLRFTLISSATEVDYVEPWFMNRRLPAAAKFSYEPNALNPILSYRYERVLWQLVLSRQLDRFTTGRLTFSTEHVNIRNVPVDQVTAYRTEGDNQSHRRLQLYMERDTRDNIFVPQHGSYLSAAVDYVGHLLDADFSYYKLQFSTSRYQILTGQNILATRIWVGWVDDRDGRSTSSDRFIVGGASTIRGYTENSLGPQFTEADSATAFIGKPKGGRYLLVSNIELRRPLFWRFGGSAFLDAGNSWWRFTNIRPLSVAFTAGLGLQFFTPIGPIRFDYGVRLRKHFDLSNGLYDLAILYAF